MESMPPVILGAIILAPLVPALAVRKAGAVHFVASADIFQQPGRQFAVDFILYASSGLIAAILFHVSYNVPYQSSLKVVVGFLAIGFFLSLDAALARERTAIIASRDSGADGRRMEQLYPMTRRFSLIAVLSILLAAGILFLVISGDISWLLTVEHTREALSSALTSVALEALFVMAVLLALLLNLIFSYSRNLKILFDNETGVLESVSRGDLSRLVPVATHDEFGLIASHTNAMIGGLRHRLKLMSALKLAEEVQRNLLPGKAPKIGNLDIAGVSMYCEDIGGDYFDFMKLPGGKFCAVVADSAGHGVGSALYMSTTRALFRSRIEHYQGGGELLDRLNRSLTEDSADTGRFSTMFFLEVDPVKRNLRWVRAGHDPAILFDAGTGECRALSGEGIPLGVAKEHRYREYSISDLPLDSVVVLVTDGIRETVNPQGEMFGLSRLHDVIRKNASASAEEIKDDVIREVEKFQGASSRADDITLVVIKLIGEREAA